MLRKFLQAIWRNWSSRISGAASIPVTVFAFYAENPVLRIVWVIVAMTCFISAVFRIWALEYQRAEEAEAQLKDLRPWVVIDGYSSEFVEDDSGQEWLWETIHLVNRGQTPAVSVEVPPIELAGRRAVALGPVPTLGPGEATDVEIRNLRHTLEPALSKLPGPQEGGPRTLRMPLVLEYRSLDHRRWTTEHALTYSVYGISFAVAHPHDQHWSDLSVLEDEKHKR